MDQLQRTKQEITNLLVATGKDHHTAFEATDGEDPEWPIWYAEYLQRPLGKLLKTDFTRSRLVYCLMNADYERTARDEDADWAPFYADHFLDRFAPTQTPTKDKLTLYHFPSCPFCARVRAAIDRLGLDVELRDIRTDAKHWDDLVAARGRGTVPVLKIDSPDGTERWMPESADIIRYLDKTYG
jgi:glutaredoxin